MNTLTLILGDLITLAVLTYIGFATHGETDLSFLPRMGITFAALTLGWFALAPAVGLFDASRAGATRQLWRPALTGLFAGQMAVVLRGLALGAAVLPVFGLVLGATTGLGMAIWRGLALWWSARAKRA